MVLLLEVTCIYLQQETPNQGGGGEVSPRKSVVQLPCQYDVTSRVSDFQNGEQNVHRRDG